MPVVNASFAFAASVTTHPTRTRRPLTQQTTTRPSPASRAASEDPSEHDLSPPIRELQRFTRETIMDELNQQPGAIPLPDFARLRQQRRERERAADAKSLALLEAATAARSPKAKRLDQESLDTLVRKTAPVVKRSVDPLIHQTAPRVKKSPSTELLNNIVFRPTLEGFVYSTPDSDSEESVYSPSPVAKQNPGKSSHAVVELEDTSPPHAHSSRIEASSPEVNKLGESSDKSVNASVDNPTAGSGDFDEADAAPDSTFDNLLKSVRTADAPMSSAYIQEQVNSAVGIMGQLKTPDSTKTPCSPSPAQVDTVLNSPTAHRGRRVKSAFVIDKDHRQASGDPQQAEERRRGAETSSEYNKGEHEQDKDTRTNDRDSQSLSNSIFITPLRMLKSLTNISARGAKTPRYRERDRLSSDGGAGEQWASCEEWMGTGALGGDESDANDDWVIVF